MNFLLDAFAFAAGVAMFHGASSRPGPPDPPEAPAASVFDEMPEPCAETRPWGICHWLGSAVEKEDLDVEMERWAQASLGGIRIVPVYGAEGFEDKCVPFMSEAFAEKLLFAKEAAEKRGMKIDMSFGAGWCFGGRTVPPDLGVQGLAVLKPGDKEPGRSRTLFEKDGTRLVAYHTGQQVKRAHRLDSGPMLNPFSPAAMKAHISLFDGLDRNPAARPRATFHDSFEYRDAAWSDEFPDLFFKYRGYRIEDHYAELAGTGDPELVARVKCDYRETLSDILVKETFPLWTAWCRERGIETHNQAHGAPANLLEFYAIAGTPETEMFGRGGRDRFKSGFDARFREGDRDPLMSKFASSAAHLAGRRFVSSESFTWMGEHFCETPEEMKALGDLLFLSGVNRLYYHATVFSPKSAPWPGWCFYAASEINPRNPQWEGFKAVGEYFTAVQTLLADSRPDNRILLYWPVYDLWTSPGGFAGSTSVHSRWMDGTAFGRLAKELSDRGFSFDYVSDSFLTDDVAGRYRAIVVPECKYMKAATLERLKELSGSMKVVFDKSPPSATPGLFSRPLDTGALAPLVPDAGAAEALFKACAAGELDAGYEPMADKKHSGAFEYVRADWKDGKLYFIVNPTAETRVLACRPGNGRVSVFFPDGAEAWDAAEDESLDETDNLFFSLDPAESMFLWVARDPSIRHPLLPLEAVEGLAEPEPTPVVVPLEGEWKLEFADDVSGWRLPPSREGDVAGDWTRFGAVEEQFSGAGIYTCRFDLPEDLAMEDVDAIDLGDVAHTATVRLNGEDLGCFYKHPYLVIVPGGLLRDKGNELEIKVWNLAANRIRAYDRDGVDWKTFEDANVVDINYGRFDASGWPVLKSGLIGPVVFECSEPEEGGAGDGE